MRTLLMVVAAFICPVLAFGEEPDSPDEKFSDQQVSQPQQSMDIFATLVKVELVEEQPRLQEDTFATLVKVGLVEEQPRLQEDTEQSEFDAVAALTALKLNSTDVSLEVTPSVAYSLENATRLSVAYGSATSLSSVAYGVQVKDTGSVAYASPTVRPSVAYNLEGATKLSVAYSMPTMRQSVAYSAQGMLTRSVVPVGNPTGQSLSPVVHRVTIRR